MRKLTIIGIIFVTLVITGFSFCEESEAVYVSIKNIGNYPIVYADLGFYIKPGQPDCYFFQIFSLLHPDPTNYLLQIDWEHPIDVGETYNTPLIPELTGVDFNFEHFSISGPNIAMTVSGHIIDNVIPDTSEYTEYNADIGFGATFSFHSGGYTIQLPRTGQTKCYDTSGTEIPCVGTGQDGEIQAGVAWPEPRFTDNLDGTIKDNLTGLMWTQDAGTPTVGACTGGTKTWLGALDYVACLNTNRYLGYDDWRLPNRKELRSLIDYSNHAPALPSGHPFTRVQSVCYWSSTTSYYYNTNYAWIVLMWYGHVYGVSKDVDDFFVWPVRTGQYAGEIQLPQTGQKKCYDAGGTEIPCVGTGQDGEIQSGVAWLESRFMDNGDGTITDRLTELIWTRDGGTPTVAACAGGNMYWQDALNYVACLNSNNYLGHSDWRLPNVNELESLVNADAPITATWLNIQGFSNVQSDVYWSSTSLADGTTWVAAMWDLSEVPSYENLHLYYVWPVRAGQVPSFGNLIVNPTTYDFGPVNLGTSSAPQTFTISNTGTADLHVSGMVLSDTTNYSLDVSPCGSTTPTITPDGNCTVSITFNPLSIGQKDTSLTVNSDDPGTPTGNVSLSGTGVVPDISVSAALLTFGQVVVGSTSTPQTITISNTGTAALVISSIEKTGTDAGMFSVTTGGLNPCPSLTPIIAPGGNCTVNVSFSPTSKAQKTAALSISSNDTDENPVNVPLSGVGKIVKLTKPNGGEIWKSGTTQRITWDTTNQPPTQVAQFRLRRTLNGGTTWKTIVTRSGNLEFHDWKVPTVLSTKKKCKVKVVLLDSLGGIIGSDVSDKVFTIQPMNDGSGGCTACH